MKIFVGDFLNVWHVCLWSTGRWRLKGDEKSLKKERNGRGFYRGECPVPFVSATCLKTSSSLQLFHSLTFFLFHSFILFHHFIIPGVYLARGHRIIVFEAPRGKEGCRDRRAGTSEKNNEMVKKVREREREKRKFLFLSDHLIAQHS